MNVHQGEEYCFPHFKGFIEIKAKNSDGSTTIKSLSQKHQMQGHNDALTVSGIGGSSLYGLQREVLYGQHTSALIVTPPKVLLVTTMAIA